MTDVGSIPPDSPQPPSNSSIEKSPSNFQILAGQTKKMLATLWLNIKKYSIQIGTQIGKYLHHFFVRDMYLRPGMLLIYFLQSLIVVLSNAYWLVTMLGEHPYVDFPLGIQIGISIVGALTILFGGSIIDYFLRIKNLFAVISLFSLIPMILIVYMTNEWILMLATGFLAFTSFILTIFYFSRILATTTLLNRARTFTIVLSLMVLAGAPIAYYVMSSFLFKYAWIVLALIIFGLYFTTRSMKDDRYYPLPTKFEQIYPLFKTDGIPSSFLFLLLTSTIVGFFTTQIFTQDYSTTDFALLIVFGLISLPIIAALLDNVGRKSISYLTLVLLSVLTIFYDFPEMDNFSWTAIRVGIYGYGFLFILISTGVLAGDLATHTTRGRLVGVFLFGTVIGILIGVGIQIYLQSRLSDMGVRTVVSDISSFILFIALLFNALTKETFEYGSPDWRLYLDRIYLVTKSGIGIYMVDFRVTTDEPIHDDLVSGGLTGIQQMLKEISHSNQEIQILDHGDTKFLFNSGQYTNAILIVKRDFRVFREKLKDFHEHFEFLNKDILPRFFGDIKKLVGLEKLRKRYFK
jgi:hypothetical protein